MTLLKLNNPSVRRIMREQGLIKRRRIGRGAFAVVFEGDATDTVWKLTADPFSYWLSNCCAYSASGESFPTVRTNVGYVGNANVGGVNLDLFLFEVERLTRIPRGGSHRATVRKIESVVQAGRWNEHHYTLSALDRLIASELGSEPALADAFGQLKTFAINYPGAVLDMHADNFMIRPSTNSLVFNDPLADMDTWRSVN